MTGRADWTLLLPLDRGRVGEAIVDGAPATGETLVELGLAASWRSIDEADGPSPLVVARAGQHRDPDDLAMHLTYGGVLYTEVPRARLRPTLRTLGRAGLVIRSVHGVAPDIASPRRYLPLDSPTALSWYIRRLVVVATPAQRIAQTAVLAGLRISDRWAPTLLGTRFAHVAVVATSGEIPSDGTANLVLTSGQDIGSRSVMVAFNGSMRAPVSITKVALRPEAVEATRRECVRMGELRRLLPYALVSAIPRTIGERALPQGSASVETCAPGATLQVSAGRWGRPLTAKIADLKASVEWFIDFGNATAVMGGLETPGWMSIFREAAEMLEPPEQVRELLAAASAHMVATPRCQRSVHLHGDAGPWNIYADGVVRRRIGVIDWEYDGSRSLLGPPLVDVLYLATYWYFAVRGVSGRAEEEQAIVDLFGPRPSRLRDARAVRSVVEQAAIRMGLARRDILDFVVALWAGQAIDIRRRQERLGVERFEASRADGYLEALARAWIGTAYTGGAPKASGGGRSS